jgi:hypothetical protein
MPFFLLIFRLTKYYGAYRTQRWILDDDEMYRLQTKKSEIGVNLLKIWHVAELSKMYCNVHKYDFGLGRSYTGVLHAIHCHNHENPQTPNRDV